MIFESKYGKISAHQIGMPKKVPKGKSMDWTYQHTIQVGFKGEQAQLQFGSFEKKLDNKELLYALKYFIEDGTGTEKGFEQFCKDFAFDTWGFEPDETDPATGYKKESLKAFERTKKRRAQAERIGITLDMAYDIVRELEEKEYSHRGDISFINLG
ncbi:hypothetical protein KAU33_15700 [Candidatus Dependentiae bacterium]|nr:hypothetical protein [Candidatus Dependentiae bacterium]